MPYHVLYLSSTVSAGLRNNGLIPDFSQSLKKEESKTAKMTNKPEFQQF
jgi:hypothetical protein